MGRIGRTDKKNDAEIAVGSEQPSSIPIVSDDMIATLNRRLYESERGREHLMAELAEYRRENDGLLNAYVAARQLHVCPERQEALLTIYEIMANFVGSEQVAIFTRGARGLEFAACYRVDSDRIDLGAMTRLFAEGEIQVFKEPVAENRGHALSPSAVIPMRLGDEVVGGVALFKLLSQKADYVDNDFRVFDVIATQAGCVLCLLDSREPESRPV